MKALILAGGKGSRLRPLTFTRSQQLLPVAGRPLLHYAVDAVRQAGCTEVGVIVGHTGAEIRASLGDGSALGVRITCIEQEQPLGLAHALLKAQDFLGVAPFLMFLGDNLLQGSLAPMVQRHLAERNAATLLLARVPDPQRFGVVEVLGERVLKLEEKPEHPQSDLALTGIYLLDGRIFDAARTLKPSARGELEITDALQVLVDRGEPVVATEVQGWWKDTGKPQDLLAANRLLLAQGSRIDPSAVLACEVRHPVFVGAGARVHGGSIGPNAAIGAGAQLKQARIEDSILMDHCHVQGVQLSQSLIGQGARVSGQGAARLHLGDQCLVEIQPPEFQNPEEHP
jgi:glucose-1-phosphate thymidylyltransferase